MARLQGAPPDYPVIYIATILSTREPKDLEEFVQKVQKVKIRSARVIIGKP